jgi:TfoX/Sxy family transcriptional regulator of competence genes
MSLSTVTSCVDGGHVPVLAVGMPFARGLWRHQRGFSDPRDRPSAPRVFRSEVGGGGSPAVRLPIVAYDEKLADRIRQLIADEPELTEKKMFGGLAFLIGGNMAVAASGQGGALVRVDPAESDRLVESTTARPMEMRGRPMRGWLRVDSGDIGTKRELAKWVGLGTAYARSLPRKS